MRSKKPKHAGRWTFGAIAVVVIAVITGIVEFGGNGASIISAMFETGDRIDKAQSPTAFVQKDIGLEYLSNQYVDNPNPYLLFSDQIDGSKNYSFVDKCATQVIITNFSDLEMQLTSIEYKASNIKVVESPKLELIKIWFTEEGLSVCYINHGWQPLESGTIVIKEATGKLAKYLGVNEILADFGEIAVGESGSSVILSDKECDELVKLVEPGESFGISIDILDDSGSSVTFGELETGFYESNGHLEIGGQGAISDTYYAIGIDTSESSAVYKEQISERIAPRGNISIPICFAPDKSCTMDFEINFEYALGNEKGNISTELESLKLDVSSFRQKYPSESNVYFIQNMTDAELFEAGLNVRAALPLPYNKLVQQQVVE